MMNLFCQRSLAWADKKLGDSPCTMGRYGCLTTCIAMISSYFKPTMTPDMVAEKVKYTKDGLLIWATANFQNFVFSKRFYYEDKAAILEHLKDPNKAVVLEVDRCHWVVATGVNWFGGYKIADPWFGDRATTKRYKMITGGAFFIKK